MRKPTTGEPCAGEPHARFGRRGGESLPYPYRREAACRYQNFNALLGARWLCRLELAMRVPTWMAGTRPAMTEPSRFQGPPLRRRLILAPMGR